MVGDETQAEGSEMSHGRLHTVDTDRVESTFGVGVGTSSNGGEYGLNIEGRDMTEQRYLESAQD